MADVGADQKMATPLERVQAAWATGDPLALHREVEQLAAEGHSRQALEAVLEALLREVRAAGADDDTEEIINGVWDRLTGWCHASRHIKAPSPSDHALGVEASVMSPSRKMDKVDRLFGQGRANPAKFGWSIHSSGGKPPDPERINEAARLLGRPGFLINANGYECEIIGAAINTSGDIAFVESRAKDVGFNRYGANQRHIDVSIRVHLVEKAGEHRSADIESYNPFFGCEVRFFEWIDRTAVLIYREKHWTFACRFGDIWPPRFVKIEDDWLIDGNILGYVGYKEEVVRRLSFPDLDVLEPIPAAEAARVGLLAGDRRAT